MVHHEFEGWCSRPTAARVLPQTMEGRMPTRPKGTLLRAGGRAFAGRA